MSICKTCGKEIPADARFCTYCGTLQDSPSPEEKTAPSAPLTEQTPPAPAEKTDAAPKTDANNRVQKECTLTSILYDADGQEIKRVSTKHRIGDYSEADLRQQIEI